MFGTDGTKSVRDQILRCPVGFGHEIDRALVPHLMRLTEAIAQYLARVASDLRRLTRIFLQNKVHHTKPGPSRKDDSTSRASSHSRGLLIGGVGWSPRLLWTATRFACPGMTLACVVALTSHEWQSRMNIRFPADEIAATNDPRCGARDHRRIVGAIGERRVGDRHIRPAELQDFTAKPLPEQ